MKILIAILSLAASFSAAAQKVVFRDEFNTKNLTTEGVGGAKIMEDSVTKEKLLIYTGKKDLIFYLADAKWKLLNKITTSAGKESQFKDPDFNILRSVHDKQKWSFVVRTVYGYTKETVDFATGKHTVEGKYVEDIAKNYMEELFMDGNDKYVMYLDKSNGINVTSFLSDFSVKNVKLQLSSELPAGKSKKYSATELYNLIETIDNTTIGSPYFTRKKVHFYVQPDRYAILVAGDEPVAELSFYDKLSGRKTKGQLFSVQDLLPKGAGDKEFNTTALLFENKVHLLAAYKSGGVYAVFDAESKKILYQYVYSEKDKSPSFNYGPVTYETLPGTTSTSVLKEKVEDITMDKFCTEMYKHSCALTARKLADGNTLITLANYDMKELAAATSSLRSGINTMSSAAWFVSTSAGIIFEPATMQPVARKTTWNEVNNSTAGEKYQKPEKPDAPDSPAAEFNIRGAYIMKKQIIGNRRYVIYYYDRELKVDERVLKNAPPAVPSLYD